MTQTPGEKPRVAFFGGSFDPPHLGHLAVARAARDALRLDRVLFAPVGMQPLKPKGSTAPYEDRAAMTALAIEGEAGFVLSGVDAPNSAGKPNYTLETLLQLGAEMPEAELFCLMGADSFLSLKHWRGAAEIPFAASVVVASRPGQPLDDLAVALPDGVIMGNVIDFTASNIDVRRAALSNSAGQLAAFYVLPGLDVEISASEIRTHLQGNGGGEPDRPLLPAAVAAYIRQHGLYR